MNPKKPDEIIKMMAESDKKLASELISFYWKDVRKALSDCKGINIIVHGLGTFKAKPWKLEELIKENENKKNVYKESLKKQNFIDFQKFAILKEYDERLEKLYELRKLVEENNLKKQNSMNLKEIWNHRKEILEGVGNAVFKTEKIEAIAANRMNICNTCPLLDTTGDKCMVPGTQPCCSACGCKLAFKTRSLSSECAHPDGPKWTAVLEQVEEDKLYQDINYNPDQDI